MPPVTEEHIYARGWLRELWDLPKRGAVLSHQHARDPDGADEGFDMWWSKGEADLVVYCVCDPCNSGWMNTLDRRAQRIVNRMTRGEPTVIKTLKDINLIASWAMKIALLYDWRQAEATLPPQLALDFFKTREPPPTAWIWLARHVPIVGGYNHQASGAHHTGKDEFYLVTFRVDQLVVQVLLTPFKKVFPERARHGDAVGQVWPLTFETIRWPPAETLSDTEYVAFLRSFVSDYLSRSF